MITQKRENDPAEKKKLFIYEDELFFIPKKNDINELASDGSASAFDETERVTEDNFDNLSEK